MGYAGSLAGGKDVALAPGREGGNLKFNLDRPLMRTCLFVVLKTNA